VIGNKWVPKATISSLASAKIDEKEDAQVVVTILRNLRSECSALMVAQARSFDHPLFWARLCLGIGFGLVALAAKSDPFTSLWVGSGSDKAQMRLIAGTPHGDGLYTAAAEIKLAATAITYWRAPGDAGVPPTFSFQGSENLASATAAYPAPQRINEQGLEAFGYRGGVTFPIAVVARDPAKPVHLRLTLDYAVCDNICLPARSVATLQLPQNGASAAEKLVAQAAARVPVPLTKAAVEKEIVINADPAAQRPRWILTWNGAVLPIDLFAEAPDGWDIETKKLADRRFSLVATQRPLKGLPARVSAQLTLTTAQQSYVFAVDLDLPAQASSAGTK
jgi:DsbC/DsbD-like thiol-disulfide interchange protein